MTTPEEKIASTEPEFPAESTPLPRAAWQQLGYEKLAVSEAQAAFSNSGIDNLIYS